MKRVDLFRAAFAEARIAVPELQERTLEGLTRDQVALMMNAVDVTGGDFRSEGAPVAVKESLAVVTPGRLGCRR